jgi:MFS transporter, ACS family, hexuronate transporter
LAGLSADVRRYRWVVLGVTWFTYMSVYLIRNAVPPLSTFIVDDLSLSRFDIGLLASAVAVGYTVAQIPAGWLVDDLGVRKMILLGTSFAGALVLGMYFVNNFSTALLLLIVAGFGCGAFPTVSTKALLTWFPIKERGTTIGINQTAVNVGGMITATVLPTVAILYGWRVGFVAIGVVTICIALLAYTLYRDAPSTLLDVEPSKPKSKTNRRAALRLMLDRNILLISLSCVGLMIVQFAMTTYLVIYLKEVVGISVALAGGCLAIVNAGGVIGKPFFGAMSDRLFGGSRKKPLLLAGILSFIFSILMQFITSGTPYVVLSVIFALFGFAALGWGGLNFVLVSEFAGREYAGLAVGYSNMIGLIGNIVGPPLFGLIIDATGSYSWGWWFLTASALASVVGFAFVREGSRKVRE